MREGITMKTTRFVRLTMVGLLAGALIAIAAMAHAADTSPVPASAPAPLKAARAKIDSRDYAGAIPLLQVALKEKPSDADALNLMGFSLRKTGKQAEALDYYNRALTLQPKHLGANEYLGELYVEMGQLDKAKERLAVLEAACGKNCEQTRDVAAAIAQAEKK